MFTVILCALYVYSIVFHLILTCKTSWRQFSWYVARDEDESYKTNLEHSLFLCLLSEIWWWLKEKPFILSNNGISWYKAFSSRNLYLHWGKIMQQKSQWRSLKNQVFVWILYFILDFFSHNASIWIALFSNYIYDVHTALIEVFLNANINCFDRKYFLQDFFVPRSFLEVSFIQYFSVYGLIRSNEWWRCQDMLLVNKT